MLLSSFKITMKRAKVRSKVRPKLIDTTLVICVKTVVKILDKIERDVMITAEGWDRVIEENEIIFYLNSQILKFCNFTLFVNFKNS